MAAGAASFPLQVVIQAVDRLTAPLKATQAKVSKALQPLRDVNNGFQRLREAAGLDRVGKAVGELGSSLSHVGSEALRAGTRIAGLVGAGVAGATALVVTFSHAGAELVRLSSKLNVGIGTLQEWRYAARLVEVEDGALEKGLALLAKNAGLAAAGTGPARGAFRRLGVDVRDASGKVRSLDELLPEISDKLNNLTDPGRRVALTTQIFGRGGADLIPFLKQGSEGLAQFAAEARRLGIVLSDEAAERGHKFAQSWERLQFVLLSVRNAIADALLPVLGDLIGEQQDWLVTHRADIARWAREIAKEIPGVLRDVRKLLDDLGTALRPVIAFASELARRFGPARVVLAALALVIGGPLILAVLAVIPPFINLAFVVATTVVPAFATAITTLGGFEVVLGTILAPLAAVAVAVGALAFLAFEIYDNWDALGSFFSDQWDTVRFGFVDAWRWIKLQVGKIGGLVQPIVDAWGGLRDFFGGLWDSVRASFDLAVGWITSKVQALVGVLPDWLVDFLRGGTPAATAAGPAAALASTPGAGTRGEAGQAAVRVSFENLPKGTRVAPVESKGVDLDLSMGYAFAGAP